MMNKIRNLLKSKDGATAIEYGLIAALMLAVPVLVRVNALADEESCDRDDSVHQTITQTNARRAWRRHPNTPSVHCRLHWRECRVRGVSRAGFASNP